MNRIVGAALAVCTLFTAGASAAGQSHVSLAAVSTMGRGSAPDLRRGASEGMTERLGWLDMRLKSGILDGSITRSDAARVGRMLRKTRAAQARLLSRDGGQLSQKDSRYMQARVDTLSTQIHWARANGVDRALRN